jgi:hypothetical protein
MISLNAILKSLFLYNRELKKNMNLVQINMNNYEKPIIDNTSRYFWSSFDKVISLCLYHNYVLLILL